MFRKPYFIETQKSHDIMSKTKYKKQNKNKLINTKTKAAVGANLSKKEKEKKTGYIIPTRNCYRKNR